MKVKTPPTPLRAFIAKSPKTEGSFWDFYRDGVSQSFIASWLKCREKARLAMVEGLTRNYEAGAFSYGTLTHGALERLSVLPALPTPKDLDTAIKAALEGVKAEDPRMSGDTFNKINEQAAIVRLVVEAYFKFWRKDKKEIQWAGVEKEFRIPYVLTSGKSTFVRGKRDGDFRAGSQGKKRLFLFETKTKSRLDEDNLMDWLPLDLQSNLYFWSMKQEYGECPAGVKYNVLKKPGLRQGVAEPFGDFLKRIAKDLLKKPEDYFHRYDVAVLPSEISAWEKDFTRIMSELEAWWVGMEFPASIVPTPNYKNPTACISQYGACEFLKVCGRKDQTGLFKREHPFNELAKK